MTDALAGPCRYDPPSLAVLFPDSGPTSGCGALEPLTAFRRRLSAFPGGPRARLCCGASPEIVLLGNNFGSWRPPLVRFGPARVAAACGPPPAGASAACFARVPCLVVATHSAVVLRAPVGMGTDIPVWIEVR